MSDFKIEKGIPVVEETRGSKGKYPFKDMEIGDSFFVGEDSGATIRSFKNSAYFYARKNGVKFTVRKVEGGCRCWRIE